MHRLKQASNYQPEGSIKQLSNSLLNLMDSSGSDQFPWRSFQAPTRSSREQRHEPIAWKEVLEGPGECKNLILLSEPGQKVVRAIRDIYGPRQGVTNQCTPQQGKL